MSEKASFYAGAASGFTVRGLTQPFDVFKIRFQLQVEPISKKCNQSYYRSLFHAFSRIYAEEGIYGFWKGHVPAQFLSIVYGSVQFYSFDRLRQSRSQKKALNDLWMGGVSGACASVVCHPIDVIRTRLVSQGPIKKYNGMTNAVLTIGVEEGVLGYFRGLLPSLLLIFPQTAIQFSVYHELQRQFSHPHNQHSSSSVILLCGSVAGIVSKTIIYPLDLTKRRLQIQSDSFQKTARSRFGELHVFTSMLASLRATFHVEGIFGLYKGLLPSTIKAALVSSLTFFFYEYYKSLLLPYFRDNN